METHSVRDTPRAPSAVSKCSCGVRCVHTIPCALSAVLTSKLKRWRGLSYSDFPGLHHVMIISSKHRFCVQPVAVDMLNTKTPTDIILVFHYWCFTTIAQAYRPRARYNISLLVLRCRLIAHVQLYYVMLRVLGKRGLSVAAALRMPIKVRERDRWPEVRRT